MLTHFGCFSFDRTDEKSPSDLKITQLAYAEGTNEPSFAFIAAFARFVSGSITAIILRRDPSLLLY